MTFSIIILLSKYSFIIPSYHDFTWTFDTFYLQVRLSSFWFYYSLFFDCSFRLDIDNINYFYMRCVLLWPFPLFVHFVKLRNRLVVQLVIDVTSVLSHLMSHYHSSGLWRTKQQQNNNHYEVNGFDLRIRFTAWLLSKWSGNPWEGRFMRQLTIMSLMSITAWVFQGRLEFFFPHKAIIVPW